MKIRLSYNELELIVGMLEKRVKKLKTGLASMQSELKGIYSSGKPRDEAAEMRAEELEIAVDTDRRKHLELKNLLERLRTQR